MHVYVYIYIYIYICISLPCGVLEQLRPKLAERDANEDVSVI